MSVYNIDGEIVDTPYERTELLSFWRKTPIATIQLSTSLGVENTYRWGEGVKGGTETPILNAKSALFGAPAQCDIRPLVYEDGSPIIKDNCIWYSMTNAGGIGGGGAIICKYNFGNAKLEMTGCLRGHIENNGNTDAFAANAVEVMFNRNTGKWMFFTRSVTSTTPQRILVYAESYASPLNGITDLYFSVLNYQNPGSTDEDPFIFYSSELEKWVLLYAKIRNSAFNLMMQVSDNILGAYTERTLCTDSRMHATGLYSTLIGGVRYVLTGSDADSDGDNYYTVWSFPALEYVGKLDLDINDRGYWGWNNLTPIPCGNGTKYIMMTFDRMQTSPANNFTYGNIYMYISAESNPGLEFPITDDGVDVPDGITATYSPTDLHMIRQWSRRYAMAHEFLLGEINLDQDIFDQHANVYPVIGDSVMQTSYGVFLEAPGDSALLAGMHQIFATYVIPVDNIKNDDIRYIALFDLNNNPVLKVGVKSDGSVVRITGDTVSKLGDLYPNSKYFYVCTSWSKVYLYSR